jgi:hypothetical protein
MASYYSSNAQLSAVKHSSTQLRTTQLSVALTERHVISVLPKLSTNKANTKPMPPTTPGWPNKVN